MNELFTAGFDPLNNFRITITSRISNLLDDKYTNGIIVNMEKGIPIKDISDYYPIFRIWEYDNVIQRFNNCNSIAYKLV